MAAFASGMLSTANTPNGSQINDDESIEKQLQADLHSQTEPQQTDPAKKAKKRKSRDGDESLASPTDESAKKKRKEKHIARRKERVALRKLQELDLDMPHGSSTGTDLLPKLTNGHDQSRKPDSRLAEASSRISSEPTSTETNKDESKKEKKDKERRDSSAAIVPGRTSLGSNREALLQSILKGCSPEKPMEIRAEPASPLEPESGDVSSTPNVARPEKTQSKAKNRHRVSMVPILPKGYTPGPSDSKGRFHCPVEGCDKIYTRRTTLGEHMNTLHRGQRFKDNNDGTMSTISLESYKLAISSGNDQNVFEIPDLLLPAKPAKSTSRELNGKKEKRTTGLSAEARREDSADSDAPDDAELAGGSEAAAERRGSSESEEPPAAGKQTASKMSRTERKSPENETSSEGDSYIKGGPPIESSKSRRPERTSSTVFSAKASIKKATVLDKSIDVGLINDDKTHPESSADEMEDWEIEPGVIAGSASNSDDDSETEHNTAYSSVYTTSAEAGIKFSGVHFQVIRVTPGSIAPGPEVPYLRICSVATGKVQVQVGEHQFSIGAHGMWRIRAGEKCVLANRHYSEAVIHVSTLNSS